MGGAFGALGGDISSWNLNPAAVGVFRKSSVTYTSVLNFSGNESGELTARKTSYLIGTVGGVLSGYVKDEKSDWKGFNLGFRILIFRTIFKIPGSRCIIPRLP